MEIEFISDLMVKYQHIQINGMFKRSELKLEDIIQQFKQKDDQIKNWLASANAEDKLEWAQHHKEKGKKYYSAQKYFEAFQEYYTALIALKEMSEIASDLINNMGITAEKLYDPSTSESSYKIVIAYNKSNQKANYRLAYLYKKSDKIQEALAQFKDCLKIFAHDLAMQKEMQQQIAELSRR